MEELTHEDVVSLISKAFSNRPDLRINASRVRLPGPKVDFEETQSVENITPLMAMELIAAAWERYANGRNFYPTKLEKIIQYASQMTEGKWEFRPDGDPICVTDGMVTGGRHRLHAILLSGKTIKANVKRKTQR